MKTKADRTPVKTVSTGVSKDAEARATAADLPCACATARQAARALTQLYDSELRDSGLEVPQFALMSTLEQGGPCGVVELARRHALDKTTVSRNLRLLERKGWIEPSAAGDKRRHEFVLTRRGLQCLSSAKPKWKKVQNQLRSGMTAEQWDEMFRVFRTVTRAAQKLQEEKS